MSLYKNNKSISIILWLTPIDLSFMWNHICLRTSAIIVKEIHDHKIFRQTSRLEQMKSLKLLSRPVPRLPVSLFLTTNRFRLLWQY